MRGAEPARCSGGEDDAGKGALVFVSSRSTHLGGAHAVAKVTTLGRDLPQHRLQPNRARLRLNLAPPKVHLSLSHYSNNTLCTKLFAMFFYWG